MLRLIGVRACVVGKKRGLVLFRDGCYFSKLLARVEMGAQQTMINQGGRKGVVVAEFLFRILVGILSSPIESLFHPCLIEFVISS